MKRIFTKSILPLLITLIGFSCVSKVDIPDDENPQLLIEMELMNAQEITATLSTSSDLNGVYPIEAPNEAVIKLVNTSDTENVYILDYDSDRNVYYLKNEPVGGLVRSTAVLKLSAELENSNIPKITAETRVPRAGKIIDVEVINETTIDIDGQEFWQGDFRFNLLDITARVDEFYQLAFFEKLTNRTISGLDTIYSFDSNAKTEFDIVSLNSGNEAIKQFSHKKGLFVNFSKIESEFIEVTLRSKFPIESENQVTDHIFTNLMSITEENFNYHLGLHNIEGSKQSVFGEPALYRSNIKDGLGIFSGCVMNPDEFIIKR